MITSKFIVVADPLLNEYGSCRPPLLLSREFAIKGYQVEIVSLNMNPLIQKRLEKYGITTQTLQNKISSAPYSMVWFKLWLIESLFSQNSKKIQNNEGILINFSNIVDISSDFWYAQGPPSVTLENIKSNLPWYYKIAYYLGSPLFRFIDMMNLRRFSRTSRKVVSNSKYLRRIYAQFGVKIDRIIYPPLDCNLFKPQTRKPSADYVVTYCGKETNVFMLKKLADAGIKIKVFGSKMKPSGILKKHPNIEFLGMIEDQELVELYSNALLTIYPFLDEPFGYVPVESMACGTPVLAFNRHGPSETILHGVTGWLTNQEEDFIKIAIKVWRNGYPQHMRLECRKRALLFDKRKIAKEWIELIDNTQNNLCNDL